MAPQSEPRRRLAALMDERRLELRLTWQEAAERGGVSLRAMANARTGDLEIRPLTQAGIEAGLDWEHGSIERILAGGDPVLLTPSLPGTSGSSGGAAGLPVPPLGARARAAERWGPVGEMVAVAMAEPLDQVQSEIAAARDRGVPESQIFADPREAYIWALNPLSEDERAGWIAYGRVRGDRRNSAARLLHEVLR